jgi:hypothetical protein
MARILHKFKITEISAVDRPAQQHAHAVIMKRDDTDGGDDIEYLAKALVDDGIRSKLTKEDFETEIAKRAGDTFPDLSSAQAFTKFVTTDPAGKLRDSRLQFEHLQFVHLRNQGTTYPDRDFQNALMPHRDPKQANPG